MRTHLAPMAVVQKQLDAYNARDIETFMSLWSDTPQIFAHPDTLTTEGAAAIRARHLTRFQEPDLFGKLINRMAMDDMVVDQEIVTRNFPEGRGWIEVIAIYLVTSGKIEKAWFKMGQPVLDKKA